MYSRLKVEYQLCKDAWESSHKAVKNAEKDRRVAAVTLEKARQDYLLSFTKDTADPDTLAELFEEITFKNGQWVPRGGATIYATVQEYITLANILSEAVDFKFNDKPLRAYPDSNPDDIANNYMERR